MKKFIFCAAALSLTLGSFAFADGQQEPSQPQQPERKVMRMDCRFYGEKHDCIASATYKVWDMYKIKDIRYGVSCDRQTIYNNGGTYMPQEQVSDGIRPWTAAVPRVELMPQGALRNEGTYTSKLETEAHQYMNGVCYVSELSHHDHDSDGHHGNRDQDQNQNQNQDQDQNQDQGQDGHTGY